MDPTLVAQSLVSGVLFGGVYSLMAVGLTLIFGVMRIVNFAHGDMMVWGMYLAWLLAARLGVDPTLGFVLDFEGPALKKLGPEAVVEAVVTSAGNAEIAENIVSRNDVTGGVRVRLRIRRIDDAKPVDLRAFLRTGGNTISTTWSYIIPPS